MHTFVFTSGFAFPHAEAYHHVSFLVGDGTPLEFGSLAAEWNDL